MNLLLFEALLFAWVLAANAFGDGDNGAGFVFLDSIAGVLLIQTFVLPTELLYLYLLERRGKRGGSATTNRRHALLLSPIAFAFLTVAAIGGLARGDGLASALLLPLAYGLLVKLA